MNRHMAASRSFRMERSGVGTSMSLQRFCLCWLPS